MVARIAAVHERLIGCDDAAVASAIEKVKLRGIP